MARSLRISPASVLLGAAFLGLVLVVASARQTTAPWSYHGKAVKFGPDPWKMVQVREGTPFVVPAGHRLVITALGSTLAAWSSPKTPAVVTLNGSIFNIAEVVDGAKISMHSTPLGPSAQPGDVVDVTGGFAGELDARAWGYLAAEPSTGTPSGETVWVGYGPDPADLMWIVAGPPFVVPTGKVLVLTAFGSPTSGPFTQYSVLRMNGITELSVLGHTEPEGFLKPVPTGLIAPAGATVSVVDVGASGLPTGTTDGQAWGYLANR